MSDPREAVAVLDFDGSIVGQTALRRHLADRLTVHDLSAYRTSGRLWASPRCFAAASRRLADIGQPRLTLLGSGDYHHFSLALLARQPGPLTLVLFDNHPDWMRPPHRYHCGTWVYSAARLPQVERIVIVGLESGDLAGPQFAKGDEESFAAGKIVLLPTTAIQAVGRHGPLTLPGLFEHGEEAAIEQILAAIPGRNVYVSLDKDCLHPEDAATNWEQGSLRLAFVLKAISAIGQHHAIVAADTVGDASPPRFRSPLKWIGSWLDRPQFARPRAIDAAMVARNEAANLALVDCLDRIP